MPVAERTVRFCPLSPALTVTDPILSKWNDLNREQGLLGYPLAPQTNYRSGARTMRFQRGYVAYHPDHGVHAVCGKLRRYWQDTLGIFGPYGFPTGDAYDEDGARVQRFQYGTLRSDMPELSGGSDLRGEIARRGIAVRDQGQRGTCSVQVMVFLLEYLYAGLLGSGYAHLSVEHANHYGNVATGDRSDGHCFDCVEAAYNAYGIVKEEVWPYDKSWIYDYAEGQTRLTREDIETGKALLADGLKLRGCFIKPLDGSVGLTEAQFGEMLALLDQGIPVGVGRDHSMAAVGYRRDHRIPGGGYIIFRNSYGVSPEYTGYEVQTFAHVTETVNDVYVYTNQPEALIEA